NGHLPLTSCANAASEIRRKTQTMRMDLSMDGNAPFQCAGSPAGFTETLTCAFDQQHSNPRPPSPDQSFATTRNTYSPGSLNLAEVCAFPVNLVNGGAVNSAFSTSGRALANVTVPGPRSLLQKTVTGGVRGR